MFINRFSVISLLLFSTLYNNIKDNSIFISPVKIPLSLSANFGELRIDHYHSGLDIKTQGVTGKEVVSAADGFVYRISVAPGGFGRALYIRHPSGYSTVYGHLEKFSPEIEQYVKTEQYGRKSFAVTLFPAKEMFPVKQGEIIAFSGNSGSSGGPHLHFEIRKSSGEIPVNPLLFEFGTADNVAPVIERLAIYPVGKNSLVNNEHNVKKISLSGENGKYYIPSGNEILISGPAGFGIKSYDQFSDSYNKCAVYEIELRIDSIPVFRYIMDEFSFAESRYINSHIDYETYMRDNVYYERTFILPNDRLSTYKDVMNRGIFNFNDDRIHMVQITVSDVHRNKSTLSFRVKSRIQKPSENVVTKDDNIKVMPYNRTNKFVSENISVTIPSGALYDTLYFQYRKNPGNITMLSDVHYIHNKFTPLHKAYTLSIKPSIIPEGKESKMLIIQLSDDFKKSPVSSTWSGGYLTADVLSFGSFYAGMDTVPPVISANGFSQNADITGKKEIRIKITDDLSGIKSYEPYIDGKWALFEYDQKNDVLIYRFDDEKISKGNKHNLSLKVSDNKDNTSILTRDFVW